MSSCLALWVVKESALRLLPFDPTPRYPRPATILQDRSGTELAAFVARDDSWSFPLAPDEISPWLKLAIVAVEDRRFADHHGIDWLSAAGAAWQDLRALRLTRGASTLSMQVIRLRTHQTRGILDKISQAFHAQQLELASSKSDILTEYLNRAPFGGNLVGAGAASWRYFGKSCLDLSLGQAALLAGLPQSPNRFRPDKSPDLARARRTHVLDQLLATHAISPDDYARANAEPLDAAWRPLPQQLTHHAFGSLPTLAALADSHPGTHLRTTLDSPTQQTAFRIISDQWPALAAVGIDSAAALVIDVPSADILAAVSLSSAAPAVDLTQSPRSTGSVLKPFIYAAAFDQGILSPSTTLQDSPTVWAGYAPSNFDRDFRGPISAADALAESRNIPAMTVLAKVGINPTLALLSQFGIHTPSRTSRPYGLSLAIGGAEASPHEIAEAYATLARGGQHLPLHLLTISSLANSSPGIAIPGPTPAIVAPLNSSPAITIPGPTPAIVAPLNPSPGIAIPGPTPAIVAPLNPSLGIAIPGPTPPLTPIPSHRALPQTACYQTLAALSQRPRTEAIPGAADAANLDAAWKTGTSNGLRDAWCAATTPRRTVVIWLGNAQGRGTSALVGQNAAAPLALKLLAMLDSLAPTAPNTIPWPAPANPSPVPSLHPDTRLSFVSPAPNTEILTDPEFSETSFPSSPGIAIPGPTQSNLNGANLQSNAAHSHTPGPVATANSTESSATAVPLKSSGGTGTQRWWFANGQLIATTQSPTAWWHPTPGTYDLRVIDESGAAATLHLSVR